MGDHQEQQVHSLFSELTDYEKEGIHILLNGLPASPMQVVQAHIMREDSVYMRDYVLNEKGDIKELCFTTWINEFRNTNTPQTRFCQINNDGAHLFCYNKV